MTRKEIQNLKPGTLLIVKPYRKHRKWGKRCIPSRDVTSGKPLLIQNDTVLLFLRYSNKGRIVTLYGEKIVSIDRRQAQKV